MYRKDQLTYTITEQFPRGKSTLILYASFDDFGGVVYCFEHDQLNRSCTSFEEAIALAREEWEREKEALTQAFPPLRDPRDPLDPPDMF